MVNALKHLLILALLFAPPLALASTAGTVTHLSGTLSAKRTDGTSKVLSVKSEVLQGDILTTEQNTYARVKFADGSEVVLRPNSQIVVAAFNYDSAQPASDSMVLNLLKGGLRALTGIIGKRNRDNVTYNTPTATIGIRGTHFGALFCNNDCVGIPTVSGKPPENGLHVDVAAGAVALTNPGGQQLLSAGQFGFVRAINVQPQIVPPEQGIRVTMPPSISENNAGGKALNNNQETKCSIQ
jgi:hypothetical protein